MSVDGVDESYKLLTKCLKCGHEWEATLAEAMEHDKNCRGVRPV